MRPPRFSIAALLALIVACGVAFAALRSPSQLWANAVSSAALAALVVAAINVALARGRRRAFCAGFLIAESSYFAVYAVPALRESIGPRMATEPLLDILYSSAAPPAVPAPPWAASLAKVSGFHPDAEIILVTEQAGGTSTPTRVRLAEAQTPSSRWASWTTPDRSTGVGYQIGSVSLISPEPFRQVGHSLLTLLFAALAGIYARHLYEAREVASDPAREIAS